MKTGWIANNIKFNSNECTQVYYFNPLDFQIEFNRHVPQEIEMYEVNDGILILSPSIVFFFSCHMITVANPRLYCEKDLEMSLKLNNANDRSVQQNSNWIYIDSTDDEDFTVIDKENKKIIQLESVSGQKYCTSFETVAFCVVSNGNFDGIRLMVIKKGAWEEDK